MARTTRYILFLFCAACNSNVANQLKAGDVSVCANSKVQQLSVINLLPEDLAAKALEHDARLSFGAVSATNVRKAIGEVSCSATIDVTLPGGNQQVPFAYVVRMASDPEEQFVVESNPPVRTNAAIQLGLMRQMFHENGSEVTASPSN